VGSGADDQQASYYARTARDYEDAHLSAGDEHFIALEYTCALCNTLGVTSLLDVGSGTGRVCSFLSRKLPGLHLVGIEPAKGLLDANTDRDSASFLQASGARLPFPDQSFDAVVATAVMHHVPYPSLVIGEMMRVARSLIVVSDANRFGQGRLSARLAKLFLYRSKLWPLTERVRTRGKGFHWSDGDGIFYSYSVYDSLGPLVAWGDRVCLLGTTPAPLGWTGPLLQSSSVMLAAMREPKDGFATLPLYGA
jgi:ubiquinone/menaquinone biosynthesis C-methylase UbiE